MSGFGCSHSFDVHFWVIFPGVFFIYLWGGFLSGSRFLRRCDKVVVNWCNLLLWRRLLLTVMCLRTFPEQNDVPLHFSEEAEGSYHAFTPAVHLPESNKTAFFFLFYFILTTRSRAMSCFIFILMLHKSHSSKRIYLYVLY